jgi:PAS domain S-box-containing protein
MMNSTNTSLAIKLNWTSRLPDTDHVRLFKETDWASTELGSLETWGPSLRFSANMVFADSRGACVYWGPQRIAFYNESFMPMAGSAHPILMGKPFKFGFPELDDAIKPVFEKAQSDGMTVDIDNIPLFTERNGYLEETFFIGQFIPLRGDSGEVEGFYNTVYESTFRVVHDRRRKVVDLITALPSSSVSAVFQHVVGALETDPLDFPMIALYSTNEITLPGACNLTLQGSSGIPTNHRFAPAQAELHQSKEPLITLFRKAQTRDTPLVVNANDELLQKGGSSLLNGLVWTGFGEPSHQIIVAPLANTGRLLGFIVLGTNPRRKYDVVCEQFVGDVIQQLLAKLSSAISIEEAIVREESLLRDLADSQKRIRYMATYAPVGLVHLSLAGTVVWANDQFYDILGISKEAAASSMAFLGAYREESIEEAELLWAQLIEGKPIVSGEFKLKRRFAPPTGPEEHACVLGSGFAQKENDEIKYIMACFTDVSHLKWAENMQILNAAAAREAKRQQELFIDMTSHELRNPLGAVMQCAEQIATSFMRVEAFDILEVLRENVDAAETILACTNHQKRIVDDVLLLSRLESRMLSITPVETKIDSIVINAQKMFKGECKADDISFTIHRHRSLTDHAVGSIMCDPSRLLQILINILGNGVRYVRSESKRELYLTYGAGETVSEVQDLNPGVKWCPSLKTSEDLTCSEDWGHGKPLYLFFSIKDSGPGLKPQEIDRLFKRFSQTSKRTHIKYGGSGLGLFISRELAEKQGGEIGVASIKGQGATFSFYVKTRRVESHPISPLRLNERKPSILTVQTVNKSPAKQSPGKSLHVLLTEDNLVNQKFLKRGLEMNGCTVHVANHGLEALECLKGSSCWRGVVEGVHIDVILMDWEMPILDGLATSKRIRELEFQGDIIRHIPIIAITANARSEQVQKALDAGMNDVLTKPFMVSEMVAKIREWTAKDEKL